MNMILSILTMVDGRYGKKYCYGGMEGEYCHCDYCNCKHGYGQTGHGNCGHKK